LVSAKDARGIVPSCLSAVAAAVAATACCLPTGALLAAIGLAGAARFQPWLMGFSIAALIAGAVLAARAKQCSQRRRKVNFAVLAVSALVVLPVVVAPQTTAALLADTSLLRARPPEGQPPLENLDLARLRDAFNAAAADRRVIAIFSPK
jgi:hypothetical protein